MAEWIVYSRPECGLCEEFLFELAAVVGSLADVQIVDINGNEGLERKYGDRIPVLTIDGDFVCAYRLDRQRLELWLKSDRPS